MLQKVQEHRPFCSFCIINWISIIGLSWKTDPKFLLEDISTPEFLTPDFSTMNSPKNTADWCLLHVKDLVICYYLGWSGSILQFRHNIIKVDSKSWLLTCSSNITLSLPSYTGSALKRELNFCNGYLSLLYFWTHLLNNVTQLWMDSRGRLLKMTKYGMCRIWGFCQHTCSSHRQYPLLGLLSEPLPMLGASYQTRSPKYL